MSKGAPEREHRRVLQLAREYRSKGYQVACEEVLPYSDLRADLIARKDDEVIVIEVKTSASLASAKNDVVRLASQVAKIPGARFDLVLTNPRKAAGHREASPKSGSKAEHNKMNHSK